MTTDIAQNIADDGADAAETAETTETVTCDRGNRYRIDGGAAVADTACPDSDAASRLSSSRTLMSFRKAAK